MQLILQTVDQHSPNGLTHFLADLTQCIGIAELSCFKYALLILHNIMSEKNGAARRVIEFIREQKALGLITEWLVEKNEKLLSIIVDIVQILCDRNSEQKAFFITLNGPAMLCNILSWARYENLLWRTTRLLKSVSVYVSWGILLYRVSQQREQDHLGHL
jgi:catenin beta 1